jgi:hypothetical protein
MDRLKYSMRFLIGVLMLGCLFGALAACQGKDRLAPKGSDLNTSSAGDTMKKDASTTGELLDAIKLAEAAFSAASAKPQDYSLVKAERMLAGDPNCTGTRCWQLVFKLTDLIPTTSSDRTGAGGELFYTVDLDSGAAVLTGRGE